MTEVVYGLFLADGIRRKTLQASKCKYAKGTRHFWCDTYPHALWREDPTKSVMTAEAFSGGGEYEQIEDCHRYIHLNIFFRAMRLLKKVPHFSGS